MPAGHCHLTARTLFEWMLCTGATVRLGRDTSLITLKNKRNPPALLEMLQALELVPISWFSRRKSKEGPPCPDRAKRQGSGLLAMASGSSYGWTECSRDSPLSPSFRFSTEIRAISRRVSIVALPR